MCYAVSMLHYALCCKADWVFSSRWIRPERHFFGLRWILPETNKKMFSSRDLSSRKKMDVGFYQKIFFCITLPEKKYSGWFHQNLFWLKTAACLYHGFLPEILFQRHPSRKYHNDGFYQNFWNGRRCFRPEFRIFFNVGFDQKKMWLAVFVQRDSTRKGFFWPKMDSTRNK